MRRSRALGSVALFFGFLFVFTIVPLGTVDEKHDPGSILAFEYFAAHKFQFGTQVIQNIGPYGYFGFPQFYAGILPNQKLCFSVLFASVLSLLLLLGLRQFEGCKARAIWLVAVAFAPLPAVSGAGGDAFEFVAPFFMLLTGHYLLTRNWYRSYRLLDTLTLALLALLALMKGTGIVLVGVLVALVVGQQLFNRNFMGAVLDSGSFCLSFLLLWGAAGQKWNNLGRFLTGSFSFISGYNEALAMDVPNEGVLVALAWIVFFIFGLARISAIATRGFLMQRTLLLCFESACLFVTWKHAYVRADH
jgi:hypothetical protein